MKPACRTSTWSLMQIGTCRAIGTPIRGARRQLPTRLRRAFAQAAAVTTARGRVDDAAEEFRAALRRSSHGIPLAHGATADRARGVGLIHGFPAGRRVRCAENLAHPLS